MRGRPAFRNRSFAPGDPFEDGDARAPFAVRLEGDRFGAQSALFSGMYGYGRFPRFARCPDGTTMFMYQMTYTSPVGYEVVAQRRGPNGEDVGSGTTSGGTSGDYYQDPTPTCDRTATPLMASNVDSNVGGPATGHLYVRAWSGGTIFDRTTPSTIRGGANQTSAARGNCLAGARGSTSIKASERRSPGSKTNRTASRRRCTSTRRRSPPRPNNG